MPWAKEMQPPIIVFFSGLVVNIHVPNLTACRPGISAESRALNGPGNAGLR